jgi:hypothetical protein
VNPAISDIGYQSAGPARVRADSAPEGHRQLIGVATNTPPSGRGHGLTESALASGARAGVRILVALAVSLGVLPALRHAHPTINRLLDGQVSSESTRVWRW